MNDRDWQRVTEALGDTSNPSAATAAARALQDEADVSDIPRLRGLLADGSFFVREAAAWALSDLGATDCLPDLLEALQRGAADGLDNDGLSAALADLAEAHPAESAAVLRPIISNGPKHLREDAAWLLEFCGEDV